MNRLTLCVTAFERPRALASLLASIRDRYPTIRVLVGDNSEVPVNPSTGEVVRLPFDCGVARVRNELLDRVDTPYVMFLEDDFVFIDDTRLDVLIGHLDRYPALDIVAGMVLTRTGLESHYEGLLEIDGDTLHYRPGHNGLIGDLPLHDVVYNFFAGRTHRINQVRWDPDLKLAEHSDFFLRAKGTLTTGYDQTVRIGHAQANSARYAEYRARGTDYARIFLHKHGLRHAIGFRGETITATG